MVALTTWVGFPAHASGRGGGSVGRTLLDLAKVIFLVYGEVNKALRNQQFSTYELLA